VRWVRVGEQVNDATQAIRTVCHGCRQTTQVRGTGVDGVTELRPMIIPGNGFVMKEKAPGVMVEEPCPVCGDSDDPGWIPGFVPPV
jgi:hypothetical protein